MPLDGPRQSTFLPVKVLGFIPKSSDSADCKTYCEGDDGHCYAVKQVADNADLPFTPFDELFCYELAAICNIAIPGYKVLEMPDGSLAFGSIWEGGVLPFDLNYVINSVLAGDNSIMTRSTFEERLSSIFALDLFLHNEDRHAKTTFFDKA